jgi:hypothetical protein
MTRGSGTPVSPALDLLAGIMTDGTVLNVLVIVIVAVAALLLAFHVPRAPGC